MFPDGPAQSPQLADPPSGEPSRKVADASWRASRLSPSALELPLAPHFEFANWFSAAAVADSGAASPSRRFAPMSLRAANDVPLSRDSCYLRVFEAQLWRLRYPCWTVVIGIVLPDGFGPGPQTRTAAAPRPHHRTR
jgi:hypothetical protein